VSSGASASSSSGSVRVEGHDVARDFRASRKLVGLVPQELTTEAFETVGAAVAHSRGLFGLRPDAAKLEQVLRSLGLWDKRDTRVSQLSGGMKRRVLIAKALVHEPRVLFLDEPSAGVDVELRRDIWTVVRGLREQGVTIILTTHYIEEAEQIADRVGVIHKGELVLVEETGTLIRRMGQRQLVVRLTAPQQQAPATLAPWAPVLSGDGLTLHCRFTQDISGIEISPLLLALQQEGISVRDLQTEQSSLEEIFVQLVKQTTENPTAAALTRGEHWG
jgi:ABC-2 type transport system ATP-binding protein